MLALISFEKDLIIPKERADSLGLTYSSEPLRFGRRLHYDELSVLSRSDKYLDEVRVETVDPEKGTVKYFVGEKEIPNYYVYEREDTESHVLVKKDGHLVDLEKFIQNKPPRFFVEQAIIQPAPSISNIQSLLMAIEEKTKAIDKTIDIMSQQTFNQRVNVHVGGGLITTYNELTLKSDICTDDLQKELNNGWRVIAVCVQPDQRRPDYILGRYNSNLDVYDKPTAGR